MSLTGAEPALARRWYPDALPRFQTASGGIVTLNAPGYDLREPWYHSFQLRLEPPYTAATPLLRARAFQVGPCGIHEAHTINVLRGRVTEQFSALDGEFVVSRDAAGERGLVAWRGRWHEVYAWMNVGGFTTGDILALYDRLSFDDTPMGVRVVTAKVPRESIFAEAVSKRIPGVAMLDIKRGADSAGLIPKWSGARTRSGEVWRRESGSDDVLVHASTTAVTVVQPDLEGGGETERLTFLDAVAEISWQS